MAIPYERSWDPELQPWNAPKKKETPEDEILSESIEMAQPIETQLSSLDERILSEVTNPDERKIKDLRIGLKNSSKWSQHFKEAEQNNSLPSGLLISIAATESMGDPSAGSHAGAKGLMQFIPSTARSVGLQVDDRVDDRLDPVKSIEAAGVYFGKLLRGSDGDINQALMKYNWGWGNVSKWKNDPTMRMPKETSQYIGRWNAAMKLQEELNKGKISSAP